MKKVVSLFCLILIAVGVVLTVLGSKSLYIAEERFWKAEALAQKIVANPETTPPYLFEKARQRFEGIINDYPLNAALVKGASLATAGLLIHEKKYDEARDLLLKIRKKYPTDEMLGSKSQFLLGFAREKAGDWKGALKEYQVLRDQYPQTRLGLEIPLYIARYESRQDSDKGATTYEAAAQYYRGLVQSNPLTNPLKFLGMNFLLRGYEEQKKWDKSLDILEEIILTYPKLLRSYVPRIEAYSRKIKQPGKAMSIYESFLKAHPDHKDAMILKKRIERLKSKRSG